MASGGGAPSDTPGSWRFRNRGRRKRAADPGRVKEDALGGVGIGETSKRDLKKIKMALRLRRETTMTLAWIAQRLQMGTKTHLATLALN